MKRHFRPSTQSTPAAPSSSGWEMEDDSCHCDRRCYFIGFRDCNLLHRRAATLNIQTCRLHKILAIKGCIFVKLLICRRTLVQTEKKHIAAAIAPAIYSGLYRSHVFWSCFTSVPWWFAFHSLSFLCAFRGRHSTLGLSSVSCFSTEKQELVLLHFGSQGLLCQLQWTFHVETVLSAFPSCPGAQREMKDPNPTVVAFAVCFQLSLWSRLSLVTCCESALFTCCTFALQRHVQKPWHRSVPITCLDTTNSYLFFLYLEISSPPLPCLGHEIFSAYVSSYDTFISLVHVF